MNSSAVFQPISARLGDSDIADHWQTDLKLFWQSMQSGVLISADRLTLQYYFYRVPNARNAIVISSGRMEMAQKYAELSAELVHAGYSVFIMDHRGQGLSQRELANPDKGYVSDFSVYQQDFAQFIHQVVLPSEHQNHIALGHSMGCAILAGYLQTHPHPFCAAILASPMFGIYTGLVPASLAESLALAFGAINRNISQQSWYFPGQADYTEKAFANNPLTNCEARYHWIQQLYREQPKSRLGGVTSTWVYAAVHAMRQLQREAGNWHLPVLLLQAGADKVVSNYAQNKWFEQLHPEVLHHKVTLQDAKHEIFMEQDNIRHDAINAINSFLAQLS
ncbi:alpha/beta fold hydrolase [Rheinheimera baltica]|uniref:alpha/beta fold hydrolase n=1 Tax=Rheinheimera baltica TaxID=67576 RepID=UPI00273D6324|nr:alpha/beta fold hydrolase [Rheinheimera baltica]MDP5151443.1 alpha/beta fold hydrolase [Rheinheimera baltica]